MAPNNQIPQYLDIKWKHLVGDEQKPLGKRVRNEGRQGVTEKRESGDPDSYSGSILNCICYIIGLGMSFINSQLQFLLEKAGLN